jgi:hypothetical protein
MERLTIEKVKMGMGVAHAPVALLLAPAHAPAGSLAPLTDFLNQQPGVRATAGYSGPERHHVLRISGIENAETLRHMLTQTFPAWSASHGDGAKQTITIGPHLEIEPLRVVDHFPHKEPLQRFVKENANTLTGAAYMAANLGLLYSAWRAPALAKHKVSKDFFKAYSAVAYTASTTILLALGIKADHPREMHAMMEELYPKLHAADNQTRAHIQDTTERTLNFLQKHPWEISSALCATGALSHLASTAWRHRNGVKGLGFEALGALGTLVAMSITAFVPEAPEHTPSHAEHIFERTQDDSMLAALEAAHTHDPNGRSHAHAIDRLKAWIEQRPLAVSAGIQSISNAGYGVGALRNRPFDAGLFAMSAASLTGNVLQTQATKIRGASFDDVVSNAAALVQQDPLLADKTPEEVRAHVARFATALSDEREVKHDASRIARGIYARLQHGSNAEGFLAQEQRMLRKSPFMAPSHVQHVQNFADRVSVSPHRS